MQIRNIDPAVVREAIHTINKETGYAGQIRTVDGVNVIRFRKNGRCNVRVGIRTVTSRVYGSRSSWSGRNIPSACWHVYRDLFYAIFTLAPDCVIVTAMAKYTKENFEDTYPRTYFTNAGSQIFPVNFGDLCYDSNCGLVTI